MLMLRAQRAFMKAVEAQPRRTAVDEVDGEAPTEMVVVLGTPKPLWQARVSPLVLQLRVVRAFEQSQQQQREALPSGNSSTQQREATTQQREASTEQREATTEQREATTEMAPALSALVDTEVEAVKAELTSMLALEAAKWLITTKVQTAEVPVAPLKQQI